MQPPPPGSNPSLPGLRPSEVVVLSERLHLIGGQGFLFCQDRCITHFGEDSIPYHPGEKSCMDRCINKIYNGLEMAKEQRKLFDAQLAKETLPFSWMKTLANDHK